MAMRKDTGAEKSAAMQKEATAAKPKTKAAKPKTKKRKRTKAQIERVKAAGARLACLAGAISALSSIRWEVMSETVQGAWHVVTLTSRGLICRCDANAGGKMICKHAFGVHRLLEHEWWKDRTRKRIRIKRQRIRCRDLECPSEKVVRNGRRKCKKKGLVQRYLCRSCGRTFSGIAGFVGRHYDAAVIMRVVSYVAARMSPDEMRKQLKNERIWVHESTIHRWVVFYSHMMDAYASTLRVDAGHQWHVDEIFFKILKMERYLFTVMDGATRFILSYEVSPDKPGFDPTRLFAAAAARALRLPRILVSDGLPAFIAPARKVFYRMRGPRFVHVREIHIQNLFNQNNISESLNGELKGRFQCVRGLKSEEPALIPLMIIYHNFFREHEGLEGRMTPAEAVGIDIVPVEDPDRQSSYERWITFVETAAVHAAASAASD